MPFLIVIYSSSDFASIRNDNRFMGQPCILNTVAEVMKINFFNLTALNRIKISKNVQLKIILPIGS
ncbi:hypothetical protein Loa_01722 [Legionella oakridgensis ATCC 33761 = DSM 21215]|uniref:Uncharacterized protein n=2 Tax=Legionella oakridgensis TaxID=29423 RepID=W0BFS4_9GAMM|nr:hypothetical protein Loa_01722 [Legionella oakridgensis ATCC 33761 = DSM 21215]ETO93223.1 hypothetical protein LOR_48c09550 [Legionella oakridgensis RV-2-2007]KTD37942.1 hypothetical protein Loak_1618 [Legionella oakridgensis]STY20337.1 Uncharacterised protein [Legionella longbeachae]